LTLKYLAKLFLAPPQKRRKSFFFLLKISVERLNLDNLDLRCVGGAFFNSPLGGQRYHLPHEMMFTYFFRN
jgi:hypothetical protein